MLKCLLFLILAIDMKFAVFIFSFALSVGLAAFGIMTAYRLKTKEEHRYASSLFYYDVFLAFFGFYSIWGHLAFSYLLRDVIPSENTLLNVLSIFPLMGFPVLIVAWYLFIQFCVEWAGKKLPAYVSIAYFSTCILILFLLGYYFKTKVVQEEAIKLVLIFKGLAIFNLVIMATGSLFFLLSPHKLFIRIPSSILSSLFFMPALLMSIALFTVSSHWFIVILFVIFYFSQLALGTAYIYFKRENVSEKTFPDFESFCQTFDISKRETEVILEICQGKANQAIADSLFISLQTVKDHVHHIYNKTGAKNRVQLTNLVRDKIKSEPAK